MKKLIALLLALTMVLSLGAVAFADGETEVISDVEDTITILAPPIITDYTDHLAGSRNSTRCTPTCTSK